MFIIVGVVAGESGEDATKQQDFGSALKLPNEEKNNNSQYDHAKT